MSDAVYFGGGRRPSDCNRRASVSLRTIRSVLSVAVVGLVIAPVFAQPAPQPPERRGYSGGLPRLTRAVQFETSDGVTIEADYYPPDVVGDAKAPVVILIHMYPADRKSWTPLAARLRTGNTACAVLAYDIRGHGGSAGPKEKELKAMYDRRDPALFQDAWKDVEAAKKWLAAQPRCDVTRVALIGASIGCSISLDYAGRDGDVKAVACLSPGPNYFGVNSIEHIKKCDKAAVLLISPEGEYEAVQQLVEGSGGMAKGMKYSGGRERHGTNMLSEDYSDSGMVRKSLLMHVAHAFSKSNKRDKEAETK